jgi:hypothetical protein
MREKFTNNHKPYFILLFAWWLLLQSAGLFYYFSDGFPSRIPAEQLVAQDNLERDSWVWDLNSNCLDRYPFPAANDFPWWFCYLEKERGATVGLVGSSLMNQMIPGLIEAEELDAQNFLSIGTCPLLMDPKVARSFPEPNPCDIEPREAQFAFLEQEFLSHPLSVILIESGGDPSPIRMEQLRKVVQYAKTVVVVAPWKIPPFAPRDCLLRPVSLGKKSDCAVDESHWAEQSDTWERFKVSVGVEFPEVLFFDPNRSFCSGGTCKFLNSGQPIMRDIIHISSFGSRLVAEDFVIWSNESLPSLTSE